MNQTWENGKKRNFGPEIGLLGPIFFPKICFTGFISTSS